MYYIEYHEWSLFIWYEGQIKHHIDKKWSTDSNSDLEKNLTREQYNLELTSAEIPSKSSKYELGEHSTGPTNALFNPQQFIIDSTP